MQNKLKYKFPAPIYARISWNIKKVFFNSYVNYFISSSIKSYGNIAFVYFKLHMYTM
jgi:hypothetical protein